MQQVLRELPADFRIPILIVQHISKGFLGGLIDWLSSSCSMKVKTAEQGEVLANRTVYVAPDNAHLGASAGGKVLLSKSEPIGGFRPSASFLFESVGKVFGRASFNVILTGMGRDGVSGLESAYAAGATVFAQDEASSVVFGMPGAACEAGVVNRVVPLASMAREIAATVFARAAEAPRAVATD